MIVINRKQEHTLKANDWFNFWTSQVKARPYMALANESRAESACSKLKGLIIWNKHTDEELTACIFV